MPDNKPNFIMSSNESSVSTHTSTEDFWCTTVKFHEAEFVWEISNFSSLDDEGNSIKSVPFSSPTKDKFKWYLEFEFRGENDETDAFRLFLNLKNKKNKSRRAFAKSTFSILSDVKEDIYVSDFECHEFSNDSDDADYGEDECWCWDDYPKKDETFRSKFLQNDTLTISVQLTFFEMNEKILASMFRRCNTIHLKQLSNDLASVLENPNFADFTISAEGKNYQVHKVILAARSNYFAKMFESGMKETEQDCVEIIGVKEDVLSEMLRFIYTGKCENLDKLADDLLIAADKYDVDNLKKMCVEFIYTKSLCVENALNTLVLADMYNADRLKTLAIDFIVANSSELMNSTTWDEIMPAYPHLLNSVCKAMQQFLVLPKLQLLNSLA